MPALHPGSHIYFTTLRLRRQSVNDGIFDQRLQGKGRDQLRLRLRRAVEGAGDPLPEAHLLQVHVVLHHGDLPLQGHHGGGGLQIVAEQTAQGLDHPLRRLRILDLRHARDGV